MSPRRALGASGFDIVAQHGEGAYWLWKVINKDMQKFQTAHSLYIQVSEEGFDDAQDDQWAIALEAIRPGNVQHNLKHVKIEITGQALFSGYSAVLLSPSSSNNLHTHSVCMSARPNPTRLTEAMVASPSERAFIRALSNLRDIERVEITGPMEANLKKQLAVAMTTRHGQKVRDWRYGGGLRSDDDISLGTWSAAMKSADGEGDDGASEYRLNPFWRQSYLPRQPMQLLAYANFDPSRNASITQVGSVGEGIIPKLPLDSGSGSSSAECDSKDDVPSGGEAGNSPGNASHDARIGGTKVKKENEENDEHEGPGRRGKTGPFDRLSPARQPLVSNSTVHQTADAGEAVEEDEGDSMAADMQIAASLSDNSRDGNYEE